MSEKIVFYKDYVAGWLDSSLADFLADLSTDDADTKYAFVTCLDSNKNPASLRKKSPELQPLAEKARVLETGLLLPTELLWKAHSRHPIFFGFDEIWFFPHDNIEPKPHAIGIVGPARIEQAQLDKLGAWMSRCSCSLALGDGEGLNFIVKAFGVAGCLLGHTRKQLQPALAPFETEPLHSR